jgi:hypothetical protein
MWLSFSIRYSITRCCLSISTVYVPQLSCLSLLRLNGSKSRTPRAKPARGAPKFISMADVWAARNMRSRARLFWEVGHGLNRPGSAR